MVLFYDNQPPPAPPTKRRKYIRRTFKIIIGFSLVAVLSMWVLASLGGSSNSLRLGIQDYLTDTTGYMAEMQKLDDMRFFPIAHIQFTDLSFHRLVKKEETDASLAAQKQKEAEQPFPQPKGISDFYSAGEVVAHIGTGNVAMDFWDMFLSRRRFHELSLTDLRIDAGIWLPLALKLQSVKVVPDADFPAIVAIGTYGTHKLDAKIRVLQTKKGLYQIPDETPFYATLGPVTLEGVLESSPGNAAQINITNLTIDKTNFTGSLYLRAHRNRHDLKLVLKSGQSQIRADLALSALDVTGTIKAAALNPRDIESAYKAYQELIKILGLDKGEERISFGNRKMDVDLVMEKLVNGDKSWGEMKADLMVQPYVLHADNIRGLINGGALKGDFIIDASGKEPSLKADVHLRGWDYAHGENDQKKEVTAQADTHLILQSTGANWEELKKNVEGELLTIGDAGTVSQETALNGGSELLKALLPKMQETENLDINCVIADFDIKGLHGTVQTLFIDLAALTVTGGGSIDFDEMMLDLQLKGQAKESGSLKTESVLIKGPLTAPQIKPGRVTIGKDKILLPGMLDPSFTRMSLTDLGLNKSHPCQAYIKKP